ncbi:hypothetical protein JCM11641_001609 [Rhodosporidiobolus odoratus]
MASATSTKRAAFAVLSFLEESLTNGAIKSDDKEGVEVAVQCIAEAFGVSTESSQDEQAFGVGKPLPALLDEAAASAPAPAASTVKEPTAEDKKEADAAKTRGNQLMAKKDYQGAIKAYGEAIEKDATNAVFWSNRAAAYSQIQDHSSAVSDAREALNIDPTFSKAYSRLGHALFSIGEYQEAVDAYEKGLELDPNNATMKSSLSTARSKVPAGSASAAGAEEGTSEVERSGTPSGGAGAGAGGIPGFPGMGAGMPGLADMMNNPAIMNMAQQMMQNGGLDQIMNNPMMQQMMNSMGGGGGGMPDMNALMNDPTMRRMAEQFGGAMGGGGGRGGRGSGGDDNNSNMYS